MENTNQKAEFEKIMRRVYRFSSLGNAQDFAYRSIPPYLVMLGDADLDRCEYWVVPARIAHKLEAMGYEYAD